uniref:Ig-like domain-containing protein n=1 Tax=Sinocyclocheilus rhinocerous TaxID=307959 RepID=A0A673GBG1_9TELE
VTLTCDTQQTGVWQYIWYKDRKQDYIIGRDQNYKIQFVDSFHSGVYSCRGTQSQAPTYSQMSDGVTLTVSVDVHPDGRVFRGETVTLTCDTQQTGVWQYIWYKDRKLVYSPRQNQNYIIPSVDSSHSGVYSCRGTQSQAPTYSQMSDGVTLTVSDLPRSTLTVTPDSPVFTGETVTLKCVINSDHSDWRYEWYKGRDSVMLQTSDHYTVNRDTLTIRRVITSDQDQYTCRGQRDKSPKSSQSSSASLSVTDNVKANIFILKSKKL